MIMGRRFFGDFILRVEGGQERHSGWVGGMVVERMGVGVRFCTGAQKVSSRVDLWILDG